MYCRTKRKLSKARRCRYSCHRHRLHRCLEIHHITKQLTQTQKIHEQNKVKKNRPELSDRTFVRSAVHLLERWCAPRIHSAHFKIRHSFNWISFTISWAMRNLNLINGFHLLVVYVPVHGERKNRNSSLRFEFRAQNEVASVQCINGCFYVHSPMHPDPNPYAKLFCKELCEKQ